MPIAKRYRIKHEPEILAADVVVLAALWRASANLLAPSTVGEIVRDVPFGHEVTQKILDRLVADGKVEAVK